MFLLIEKSLDVRSFMSWLNPIRNNTIEIESVGNDSLMKVYSKHPAISVMILMAAIGRPIWRHIFLATNIKATQEMISKAEVAQ